MKICRRFKKMLSLYIDSELPKREKQEFENHLDECPECQEKVALQQLLVNKLHHLKRIRTSDDFDAVLRTRIRIESGIGKRRFDEMTWGWTTKVPVYGMSLALIIIAAVLVFEQVKKANQPERPQAYTDTEWYGRNPSQNSSPVIIEQKEDVIYVIDRVSPDQLMKNQTSEKDTTIRSENDSLKRHIVPVNQVTTY